MNTSNILSPKLQNISRQLGENIKLARLRRKLSVEQVAERANMSRSTLWAIERGTSTVAIGAYLKVLFVLGLENDFGKLAADDDLGRKVQDAQLLIKERAPKKKHD
jgi:transcriptional regulator with XRE-family HTH domain